MVGVVELWVENDDLENDDLKNDEKTDVDQAERTDLSKNLLQVTSGVIVLANKRHNMTKERVGTSGDNDTLSFTLLASRTPARRVHIVK